MQLAEDRGAREGLNVDCRMCMFCVNWGGFLWVVQVRMVSGLNILWEESWECEFLVVCFKRFLLFVS